MPATAATPSNLIPMPRQNSGLIFDATPRRLRRRAGQRLTERRREGVGSPTTLSPSEGIDRSLLVIDATTAGLSAITALDVESRGVARRFRFMPGAETERRLVQVVESTQTLLKLAAAAGEVAEVNLEQLCEAHGQAARRMHDAVAAVIRAQLVSDWEALADALDRDLIPALGAWRRVFAAIAGPFDAGPSGHAA